jgi:hypothetical protein
MAINKSCSVMYMLNTAFEAAAYGVYCSHVVSSLAEGKRARAVARCLGLHTSLCILLLLRRKRIVLVLLLKKHGAAGPSAPWA